LLDSAYWGWFKFDLSEIAAVRKFLDNIVKDSDGRLAIPRTNR